MSQKDSGSIQHQAEHTRSRRRSPVMGYLVILFAVAFLLLLLAYFQQQRMSAANSQAIDALKQSVSATDSIQILMSDNEELRKQVEELQGELAGVKESQAEALRDAQDLTRQVEEQSNAVDAMQWFWQIESAYAQKRYTTARELIQQFEALPHLKEALPKENTTGTQRFSPSARYQEIYDALY